MYLMSPRYGDFEDVASKSLFGGLPEIEIQQKIANWKAESLMNPVSKELASEDASIESYGDFESDRGSPSDASGVGRHSRGCLKASCRQRK